MRATPQASVLSHTVVFVSGQSRLLCFSLLLRPSSCKNAVILNFVTPSVATTIWRSRSITYRRAAPRDNASRPVKLVSQQTPQVKKAKSWTRCWTNTTRMSIVYCLISVLNISKTHQVRIWWTMGCDGHDDGVPNPHVLPLDLSVVL